MDCFKWLAVALVIFSALSGIGASICSDCTSVYSNSVPQGTVVQLQGPASSPQGRDLDYQWAAYNCTDNHQIDLYYTSGKLQPSDYQNQNLNFLMPPAGEYRIALTVRDHLFPSTCVDMQTICFTTSFVCPELCCQEMCEATTPGSGCPWHMSYSGPVGNYVFKWLVDGLEYKSASGEAGRSVYIDWRQSNLTGVGGIDIPLAPGPHTLDFELFAEDPETGNLAMVGDCDVSCSCSAGLTPCTVYKVQKPMANITPVI